MSRGDAMPTDPVLAYHEETKHHPARYARSAGYMDWANQPNPFRFYEGKDPIPLPFIREASAAGHEDLYRRDNNPAQPLTVDAVGALLELSLGLSAWKIAGNSKWALRMNPSSGNLHPTEAHLILPAMESLAAGAYHYTPLLHALEPRAAFPDAFQDRLDAHFGVRGFLVGLSSVYWRESWKYGERAYRYCNLDAGHALAALSVSANLLGWKITCLNAVPDAFTARLLGFDKTPWRAVEEEDPDLLCFIRRGDAGDVPEDLPDDLLSLIRDVDFPAAPNPLSRKPVRWDIIYDTARAAKKGPARPEDHVPEDRPFIPAVQADRGAEALIRRRRSGVSFDPSGVLSADRFFSLLDKTLPRRHVAPFDAGVSRPCTDLLLFVHRVDGLDPGLYFFIRTGRTPADLAPHFTDPSFSWTPVSEGFPLYRLQKGNFKTTATMVSCHQDIAGAGVFSLGMIAEFREIVASAPRRYRRLLWECGMIGQVLYLEAEARGLRGTGIGCFFDDEVHRLLGLAGDAFQSLYHFTVGKPVEDPRLTTLPPYSHLDPR